MFEGELGCDNPCSIKICWIRGWYYSRFSGRNPFDLLLTSIRCTATRSGRSLSSIMAYANLWWVESNPCRIWKWLSLWWLRHWTLKITMDRLFFQLLSIFNSYAYENAPRRSILWVGREIVLLMSLLKNLFWHLTSVFRRRIFLKLSRA